MVELGEFLVSLQHFVDVDSHDVDDLVDFGLSLLKLLRGGRDSGRRIISRVAAINARRRRRLRAGITRHDDGGIVIGIVIRIVIRI